ncbi:MAG: hypothetical protein A2X94_01620 [Bdellovibrionales bacterium GWB1_55_8]|nr:MAG: hypothetical protein A2X94_01620 [Bdellovibrionales bacterium GWB1_55_8]
MMKMRDGSLAQVLIVLVLMLSISGCASATTRIFPKENGDYMIVSSSYSESSAYDGALDDATDHCTKQGRAFVMVDEKSEYKGMDKDAKAAVSVASAIFGAATKDHGTQYQMRNATQSRDDNKVTMTFKCK